MNQRTIGQLLANVGPAGAFAARRTARADDLKLEIKGVGPLRFPLSAAQARKLRAIARPARYGHKERTLLDKNVRHTWEIPKSRVKIDQRRWNQTLHPTLQELQAELGLPEHCKLKAELHSMLLYEPGQFFQAHQDSEKTDDMVGTLLVTLPSDYKGGALVIEHQGEQVTYRATKGRLSFIAFYADCQHEVRPVTQGHRVVLSYNLMLRGDATAVSPSPATVKTLANRLRDHFRKPRPARYARDPNAPPRDPPQRLVYLLDHQYTQRSLGAARLKRDDAARVAALREAATQTDCEIALALAEVEETWHAFEKAELEPRGYRSRRRWHRTEDEDEWELEEDETPEPFDPNDPDAYSLEELIDWSVTLTQWRDLAGKRVEPLSTAVDEDELAYSTPSASLKPYASEYEGYMGNWGNTMDRWYRRAAVVLWPRDRDFAVRAEANPAWAIKTVDQRIRAGAKDEARRLAETLLPFWKRAAEATQGADFFTTTLRVAEGLDAPKLAASLLGPLRIEAATRKAAPPLVGLYRRYGEPWMRSRIGQWPTEEMRFAGRDREEWLARLPGLCEALRARDEPAGPAVARLMLEQQWQWLTAEIELAGKMRSPSQRDRAAAELEKPLLGFLEAAAIADAQALQDQAIQVLSSQAFEPLCSCLVGLLRRAAKSLANDRVAAAGLPRIHQHCVALLEQRLDQPKRDANDWSIQAPLDCACELCRALGGFLADADATQLDWPLKKQDRQHIHGMIEAHELPVRHETRRSGRPYTLVLTKTRALFQQLAAERKRWRADLAWLRKQKKRFATPRRR